VSCGGQPRGRGPCTDPRWALGAGGVRSPGAVEVGATGPVDRARAGSAGEVWVGWVTTL
jgi:hypothetical protein